MRSETGWSPDARHQPRGRQTARRSRVILAHLEPGEGVPKLFEPDELLKWLDQMHIYDIGRDAAGQPLARPDW